MPKLQSSGAYLGQWANGALELHVIASACPVPILNGGSESMAPLYMYMKEPICEVMEAFHPVKVERRLCWRSYWLVIEFLMMI